MKTLPRPRGVSLQLNVKCMVLWDYSGAVAARFPLFLQNALAPGDEAAEFIPLHPKYSQNFTLRTLLRQRNFGVRNSKNWKNEGFLGLLP